MAKPPEDSHKTEIRVKSGKTEDEEKTPINETPSIRLSSNIAGMLCYLGVWISGIIFLVLEQKNKYVRFHAAQSIVLFGGLNIIGLILGNIPGIGWAFNLVIGILYLILWIVMMVKAYKNELYKIPLAGDLAEKLEQISMPSAAGEKSSTVTRSDEPAAVSQEVPSPPKEPAVKKEKHSHFYGSRTGRTVASCMSIFWYFVCLIFLNLYSKYIAFYHPYGSGNSIQWIREPVLTRDFYLWLPQINVALILAIIASITIIIVDNYILYEVVQIIISLFFAVAVGSLLSIFPFDFGGILEPEMSAALPSITRLILLVIIIAFVISIIVRIVRLTANLIKNNA